MSTPSFLGPQPNPFGLSPANGGFANPTLADLDNDGDLDAIVGNYYGELVYFQNTGTPSSAAFATAVTNPFGLSDVGSYAAPTLADLDGDGDLDVIVGTTDGNMLYFENTGSVTSAAFVSAVINPFNLSDAGVGAAPTLADLDGDGDLDAVIGEHYGNLLYFQNTGSASSAAFATVETNPFSLADIGDASSPTFADLDGDGDLDAIVGEILGNLLYFQNTGSASSAAFAAAETNLFGLSDVGIFASPTFADLDGDGDLDAIVGNSAGDLLYFKNEGAVTVTITQSDGATAVTEGGATDSFTLVLGSQPTADVTITLDTTNGQASVDVTTLTFTSADWNTPQTVTVTAVNDTVGEGSHTGVIGLSVSSADVNYNGLSIDPVRVGITDNDLPTGTPTFQGPQTNPFGLANVGIFSSPTFADLDGDGDLDAIVGQQIDNLFYFQNTGSASSAAFATADTNPFGLDDVGYGAKPTFADLDADGDLDAIVGEGYGNLLYFQNTGSASSAAFATANTNPFGLGDVGYEAKPTFADLDADGDLDAIVGQQIDNLFYFQNTGLSSSAAFAAATTNPFGLDAFNHAAPTLADLDGDGDLDAIVGDPDGNQLYFQNTGSASSAAFAAAETNLFGLSNVGNFANPTLADLDGDGDLDAIVGNEAGDLLYFENNPNEAPIITSNGGGDTAAVGVAENTTAVTTVTATDADNNTVTYSISGGADAARFTIVEATGVLTFASAPNFESPTDTGANNIYEVIVQASDGTATDMQAISITVTDAYEGPTETDGIAAETENQAAPLTGGTTGDGNGDGILDGTQSGVATARFLNTPTPITNPGTAEATYVTLVADSAAGKINTTDSTSSNITFFSQTDTSTLIPSGLYFALGRAMFSATTSAGATETFSFYVDPSLGVTGFWQLDGSGNWDNTASATLEGGKLRLDFSVTDGGVFDEDGTVNGAIFAIGGLGAFGRVITGTEGNDYLGGTVGNDTMSGLGGNDTLNGGAGNDAMRGGAGNDVYVVDTSGDTIVELNEEGADTVQSSVTWTLGANLENLILTGTAAINGSGNAMANRLTGNSAANDLNGDTGDDTLMGGAGNDTLLGGTGNDFLDGGIGDDSMLGGAGNDIYIVNSTGDRITETSTLATEIDTVRSSVTWQLGGNLENLVLIGTTAINGTGNWRANNITGNDAANTLHGWAGNDTMSGWAGDDVLYGNDGNDILYGNAGNDILNGGPGNDSLSGGAGNDIYVVDSTGDRITETSTLATEVDTVRSSVTWTLGANLENLVLTGSTDIAGLGNAQANRITGNSAGNVLNGRAGADTLAGGGGHDTYYVDNSGDVIVELANQGSDVVISTVSCTLAANVEGLYLSGSAAINGAGNGLANLMRGNGAANTLNGAAGADTLEGGLGRDSLTGGTGADQFVFNTALSAGNVDAITDFAHGVDKIVLDADIFTQAGSEGVLTTGAFRKGAGLTSGGDADDRIILNITTGALFYDADGNGAGAAVQFAALTGTSAIGAVTASDFLVVA